jgi:hypothetical protein
MIAQRLRHNLRQVFGVLDSDGLEARGPGALHTGI